MAYCLTPGASASGAGDAREVDLRHELQETLARLREIQASLGTEGGEVESIRAASEEAEKLKAVLRRRDYRILHLTRALDAMSSGQARASTPP